MLQGLASICGERVQLSAKTKLESSLLLAFKSECKFLRKVFGVAHKESLTADGWSAALGMKILGAIWHFVNDDWKLHGILISALNIGDTAKTGRIVCAVLEETFLHSLIVGSESTVQLSADFLAIYSVFIRFIVHTSALVTCSFRIFHGAIHFTI